MVSAVHKAQISAFEELNFCFLGASFIPPTPSSTTLILITMPALDASLVLASLLFSSAAVAVPAATAVKSTSTIPSVHWYPCPTYLPGYGLIPKIIECGNISVPRDHAKPNDAKINLVLNRIPSSSNSTSAPGLFM